MISLAAIPSFVDIPDSTFAVDQPVKASTMTQLAHNAKFAMVRREVIAGVYTHGETIAAPKSGIDGYQYSYDEVTFWWCRDFSYSPATKLPSGGGCILSWADSVSSVGLVSCQTNYFIDGGDDTPTNDGQLFVLMLCQRNASLHFAAVPTWADVEDADISGGEAALATVLGQMNTNVRYGCVRKEFFVQTLYNGQTVALPTSPVDGYTYARNELQYLPAMISSLPASGHTSGSGDAKQFGCCVGGMPSITTPATAGQVSCYVQYQVNGGVYTPTNDGTILVLVIATRSQGSPPIPPAVRTQPPAASSSSFGTYALPTGGTVGGFPIKGVGDPQLLDVNAETKNELQYTRSSPVLQTAITASSNLANGQRIGGDSGVAAFGSSTLVGFNRSPVAYPLEVAGDVSSFGPAAQFAMFDTAGGGVPVSWDSSGGVLQEWLNSRTRRTLNGTGQGFDRTSSTYTVEAAGNVANISASPALIVDDTNGGGLSATWQSTGGFLQQYDLTHASARLQIAGGGQGAVAGSAAAEQWRVLGSGDSYNSGANAGVFMGDRTSGLDTGLYASGGYKRLWDDTFGDAIRSDTSGNIGTANITPAQNLDVGGAIRSNVAGVAALFTADRTTANQHGLYGSGDLLRLWHSVGGDLVQVNSSAQMGIGGSPTSEHLSIQGSSIYDKLLDGTLAGAIPLAACHGSGNSKLIHLDNGVFDGTLFRRVANVHTDNTFHVSTSFLSQGSMAPAPFDGVAFPEFNTGTGQIDVKVTTAGKLYRTNGTTISVPTSTTSFATWAGQTVDYPPPPSGTSTNTSIFFCNICWDPVGNALVIQQVEADISDSSGTVTAHPSSQLTAARAALAVADGLIPIVINAAVELKTTGDGTGGGTNSDTGNSGSQPLPYL